MPIRKLQGEYEKRCGYYYEFSTEADVPGEGGMERVYLGKKIKANGTLTAVAIKAMFVGLPKHVIERAKREASIQLHNDNLVQMFGFIETIDKDALIRFKLNNNEHIGFTHPYFVAKLAISLPAYMKCSSTTVGSKSKEGEIQIKTRTENENLERNTLGYDCGLSIPEDSSDTLKTHPYHYALKYEGLVSIDHKVNIPEWDVKYYEVNLSKTNFSISSKDTITVKSALIKTDVARDKKTTVTITAIRKKEKEIILPK